MKRWQLWLGLLISGVFLYLALRGLRLQDVWDALRGAKYIWLIPGVIVYFLGVAVRAWRWQYLLKPVKLIPFKQFIQRCFLLCKNAEILRSIVGVYLRDSRNKCENRAARLL